MNLYGHVVSLDVTGFVKPFEKARKDSLVTLGRTGADKTDHRYRRLLRARRERPSCGRAAEQRDELAPPDHSITSSARARSVGGTSRPSARAVTRLMTNSNFVDCMTGRSAGFAPFSI